MTGSVDGMTCCSCSENSYWNYCHWGNDIWSTRIYL